MQEIPFFHFYDLKSKTLTLRNASYFPLELLDYADQIEVLDMSQGLLTSLPEAITEFQELKIAFFSKNLFTDIPAVLKYCTKLEVLGFKSCQLKIIAEDALPENLKWLILTDNHLQALPRSIGKLKNLKKLALTGNDLQSIPKELELCQELELIRLSANKLSQEPSFLFKLPKLAWYADSGNCFNNKDLALINVPIIYGDQVNLTEKIGESPSCEVWKATIAGYQEPVAVKKYRGTMTSDGYIIDDLKACLAAQSHPKIIPVNGQFSENGNLNAGLVLKLIPASYRSLGLPPSLESCTRDTFLPETSLSLEFILQVLKDIASAADHLHQRGIAHGDLYAHNILTTNVGECFLGDFGAASFYDRGNSIEREQIEVRAFGYLIQDLLGETKEVATPFLKTLMDRCLNLVHGERPQFAEILELLESNF